jgi:hypothetical protein
MNYSPCREIVAFEGSLGAAFVGGVTDAAAADPNKNRLGAKAESSPAPAEVRRRGITDMGQLRGHDT